MPAWERNLTINDKPMTVEALNKAHLAFHDTIKESRLSTKNKDILMKATKDYIDRFSHEIRDFPEDTVDMQHPTTVKALAVDLSDLEKFYRETGYILSKTEKEVVSRARSAAIEAAAKTMGEPVPSMSSLGS